MRNLGFVLIGFFSFVFFISCKDKESTIEKHVVYDLQLVKEVEIKIDNPEFDFPSTTQHVVIDGIETLIVYYRLQKLAFYNLENAEKYHEVFFNSDREIEGFNFVGEDSIFLFYENVYDERGYLDSTQFVRIDMNGNLLQTYSISCDLIPSLTNSISKENAIYPKVKRGMLESDGNVFFMLTGSYGSFNIGTKEFVNRNAPVFSYYNLKTQKLFVSEDLRYPNIKVGTYYPSDFNTINYCKSKNGFPLIRFFYSSQVYEWDYVNDKINVFPLKSMLIDSILPLTSPTRYSDNNIDAMYLDIHYDPYRKLYFSMMLFSPEKFGAGTWTMIIADENLNYLGEMLMPNMTSQPMFTKDYIISAYVKEKGILLVTYNRLVKREQLFVPHLKRMQDSVLNRRKLVLKKLAVYKKDSAVNAGSQIVNYVKSFFPIVEQDYTIVTVYAMDGCPSCREKILYFINNNINVFKQVPFYLVVTGTSSFQIKEELKNCNFKGFNNIILDTIGIVRSFTSTNSIKNPRLTIIKSDSVVLDSIYEANDIESSFVPKLMESLNLIQK